MKPSTSSLLQAATALIGIFYLTYSALELYSWLLSVLTPNYGGLWFGFFLEGDIGWFVSLFTVGILMLGSAVKKPKSLKGFSCMLVGSALGVTLLGLQLLVVTASLGDTLITLHLFGEGAEYCLAEGLLTPVVAGGLALAPLLAYSLSKLKRGDVTSDLE